MRTTMAVLFAVGLCIGVHFMLENYLSAPLPPNEVVRVVSYPEFLPSDTVTRYVIRHHIAPARVDSVPVPSVVDTAAIIAQYLQRVTYTDTLIDDTTALVAITDTIQFNRIQSRALTYQNRRPTRYITLQTVAQPPEKRPWHINAGIAYTTRISPVVGVQYKNISVNYVYRENMVTLIFNFNL